MKHWQGEAMSCTVTAPPFPFEDTDLESPDGEMLLDHLRALGVPVDSEPDWRTALLIQEK